MTEAVPPPAMPAPNCWCGNAVEYRGLPKEGRPRMYACTGSKYHDPYADGRPKKIGKLYVAGPMSGYPENNYPAFHDAADRLRDAGYVVVNPAEYGTDDAASYQDLLRADLLEMLQCDAVATLERWWESVGGRNEIQVAGLLRMPVRSVDEWLARAGMDE